VASTPNIWQAKVRARIGWPKKGCVVKLVRDVKRETGRVISSRTAYGWLRWDRSPHDEAAILDDIAAALRVPVSWLKDGKAGDPPHVPAGVGADWIQLVDRAGFPPRIKQLAYALADFESAMWLADAYERLYLPTRRRGARPPSR
jgi:hypothetical protein